MTNGTPTELPTMLYNLAQLSVPLNTPSEDNSFKLSNCSVDEFLVTEEILESPTDPYPSDRDGNVKIWSKFNDNYYAGSLQYDADGDTEGFIIKRRTAPEIPWQTIGFLRTEDLSEIDGYLTGTFVDRTAKPNEKYEYFVAPYSNGTEYPGITPDEVVMCWTNGIVVSDMNTTYYTPLEPSLSSITQKTSSTIVEPINGKYPISFKLGNKNYISGSAAGVFVPIDGCNFTFDNEAEDTANAVWKYRKTFREWLCNGEPKIIKYYDGRTFLVAITDEVSDDDSDHNWKNITSFSFSEIGDVDSIDDLINAGIVYQY